MTDISDVNSDQLKTAGQINIIKSEIYSTATKRTLDGMLALPPILQHAVMKCG